MSAIIGKGWIMFGIERVLAFAGLLVKAFIPNKFERGVNVFVIISYVAMGWLLLLFIGPLSANFSKASMILVFAGGLCYTLGILFFKMEKLMSYSHLIWHIMVVGGSVCHWIAIFLYVVR